MMAEVTPGVLTPEPVVAPEQATPAPESTVDPQAVEQPEQPPKKVYDEDEVNKIVQKRLAKESKRFERVARAEAEAAFLRQQLEAQTKAQQPQPQGKPKAEDYPGNPEAFVEALTEWKLDQRLAKEREQSQRDTDAEREERDAMERAKTVNAKLKAGAEKYEDFEDVALDPDVPISRVMAAAIAESDKPADLAYYLGSHRDEAAKIAALPPTQQVRKLAEIESKLGLPSATKMPAPIKPNAASASVETGYRPDMTDKQYNEWRRRSLAQKR